MSHAAYLPLIARDPHDHTTRAVYADWLEENAPDAASRVTIDFLRHHKGPAWAALVGDRVVAGRKWTTDDMREANRRAGKHWFDRDTMRFFGTRLMPAHVYHGPGGIYFVHSGDNFDRSAREYRVAVFHPLTGETGSWSTYHSDGDHEFAGNEAHATARDAVRLARQLAAGNSPYSKNRHWDEAEHGATVDVTGYTPPAEPHARRFAADYAAAVRK